MDVPIQILGDRAVVQANEGTLVTYLDKWSSHGYVSSLIEKDNVYAIGKVIYDLNKVPINKVQEIAHKIGDGLFECPVCQRLVKESGGNNGEKEPITEEEKTEGHELIEKPKEEVKEPELDEVEIRERERARAIQEIVNALDEILLMKVMQ